jgi:hypothetical protein
MGFYCIYPAKYSQLLAKNILGPDVSYPIASFFKFQDPVFSVLILPH